MATRACLLLLLTLFGKVRPEIGTFWHVTDLHLDVNYTVEGAVNDMCWDSMARGPRGQRKPGQFGDYMCDAPRRLVQAAVDAMAHIKPDPDFILWTGDDTAHVSDDYFSEDTVFEIVKELTEMLAQGFPDTLVLPVLGNHDAYPKSQVPEGSYPLQTRVAKLWKPWLDQLKSAGAYSSFNAGGRYWADLGGVTVVAVNTLVYYTSNKLVSEVDTPDPDQQFQWLDQLLTNLTYRGQRVYLMGHIPPGSFERYQQTKEGFHWFQDHYNYRFSQLVEKHAGVIEGQFFGHHHTDSYRLFFSEFEGERFPVSYLLVAPGVTPWKSNLSPETGANNPGIRLVSYDKTTGKVTEVSTYYLNLTEANANGKDEWRLEYNFTSSYGLSAINADTLYKLAQDMKTNTTLFDRYYLANTVRYEDPAVCTSQCRQLHWCSITEVNYDRFLECNQASSTLTSALPVLTLALLLYFN